MFGLRMKVSTSTVVQILLGACDVLNLLLPQLTAKNQATAQIVLAALHIVVNRVSHLSNPDGTDAKVAYEPK